MIRAESCADSAGTRSEVRQAAGPGTVLIVEDEQIVALDLNERLRRMGHSVVGIAASGEEAIELARQLRPEIVLMDIKLQGRLDGIDAAATIREDTDAAIVYLTAFADDTTLQRAMVTQPHGYILKPFNERELHVIIEVSLYRLRLDHALHESEMWRATLLHSVGDAVIATDSDGLVKFMNPAAELLTGWADVEACGMALAVVFPTIPAPDWRETASREPSITNLVRRDGSECPIELRLNPIRASSTHAASMGTVCVFRDVTERRRLQERQRFLAAASSELSSSLDANVVIARITEMLAASAHWCAIHLADEHGALRVGAFAHRDPAVHAVVSTWTQMAVLDQHQTEVGTVARTRCPVLANNSDSKWSARALGLPPSADDLEVVSAIIVPLVARNACIGTLTVGSLHTFDDSDVAFMQDVAARVATSIDNAGLYAEARHATEMRDEVLAIVSHDLRTPLTTVAIHADQLLGAPVTEKGVVKSASAIKRNADRMAGLISDLIDIARIDAGRLSINVRRVSASALVAEVASSFEALAAERGIHLIVSVLSDGDIAGDRDRIVQVLGNVIGNALKFSPKGGAIELVGTRTTSYFQFSISDQGSGLTPDQLEHVFERYWQAPDALHRGSGLGLYIARGIVEAHGGRIWAESIPTRGSTFHFTIPLARGEELLAAPP